MILPKYRVIRDTREKEGYGWTFLSHTMKRRPPICDGMIEQKLEVGDYSLIGYEDILAIERKEDFSELWVNYSTRDRFERELDKMSGFKYPYVLVESQLTPDHFNLSPPQYETKAPGKALIRWIISLSVKYGVHIMPVGQCGRKTAQIIFEEVVRHEKDRWVQSG
jgi:hypothetical protein